MEKVTTIVQELLAFARQDKATSKTVKELETKFRLKITDLTRQSWLSDPQAQRRLGDGTEIGHGHEGSCAAQVHVNFYTEQA